MAKRSIDVFRPGMVVHPILGEAYPGGVGDELGIALDHLLGDDLKKQKGVAST